MAERVIVYLGQLESNEYQKKNRKSNVQVIYHHIITTARVIDKVFKYQHRQEKKDKSKMKCKTKQYQTF